MDGRANKFWDMFGYSPKFGKWSFELNVDPSTHQLSMQDYNTYIGSWHDLFQGASWIDSNTLISTDRVIKQVPKWCDQNNIL